MATYRTTRRIWTGAPLAALPIGSLVEFDGGPTGVYKGRCELVAGDTAPAAPETEKERKVREKAEKKAAAEEAARLAAEEEAARIAPPPPPPAG